MLEMSTVFGISGNYRPAIGEGLDESKVHACLLAFHIYGVH